MSEIIGGGGKKILYTLSTLKAIGVRQGTKALVANNTCKACGLGMGGQQGGMTNELGEFPSVCNKSVQAQSTDIQAAIPAEIFTHSLDDFNALSGYELEHLGRLDNPLYKAPGDDKFQLLSWPEAMAIVYQRLQATAADRSFFYASGRASNEAGFLLQAWARCFGTNNVNNCSFYCHQATGVGLQATVGTGTATVELADLKHCDTLVLIGANPSSNHPRLLHQLKALRERGGKVIVINPAKEPGLVKFAVPKSITSMLKGGSEIASHYLQPRIGSDWYVLSAIAKAILATGAEASDYIDKYTTGFADYRQRLQQLSWSEIEVQTGLTQQSLETIAELYAASKHSIFAWGMGITHHQHGTQNVEAIANLALLRGMVGKPGAGLLPLRGHSNVQGIGTIGVKPELKPTEQQQLADLLAQPMPSTAGMDTLHCLQAADQNKIDLALMMGGNLLEATPNTDWAVQAMNNIACRIHLTTTLNRGHVMAQQGEMIILPVKARDEEDQATTQESMFNYLRMSDGGIKRHSQTRSEAEIIADIASHTLAATQAEKFLQWRDFKRLRKDIARVIKPLSLLETIDENRQEGTIAGRILHQPRFNMPQQRAQFASSMPPSQSQAKDKPFMLATIRSEGQFNSMIYEETDSYRFDAPRDALLMNHADIQALGLKRGDRVVVSSASGEWRGMLLQEFDLPSGNVMAYYPEANVLTASSHDPRSKTPNFKSLPVSVTRLV